MSLASNHPLRVISINKYYVLRGGADREMLSLEAILRKRGHEVASFASNQPETIPTPYRQYFPPARDWGESGRASIFQQARALGEIIYNRDAKRCLAKLIADFKPDVAHLHNIHFELSPSVLDALHEASVPVIMHLHDSRLFCPNAYFFTKNRYCDRCLYHRYHHAAWNRCIKGNWKGSLAVAISHAVHHWRKCWVNRVTRYISPTNVIRDLATRSGIPGEKIDVFTYAAPRPPPTLTGRKGDYFLFCGYHVKAKGVDTLIEAMTLLPKPVPLRICGQGPETARMKEICREKKLEAVEFLGFVSDERLSELIAGCLAVVLPSAGFDNSNSVVREANAFGKPVLGSRTGGIPETVIDGKTGLLFDRGDAAGLAGLIETLANDVALAEELGTAGRKMGEELCGEETYYNNLMATYSRAREKVNRNGRLVESLA